MPPASDSFPSSAAGLDGPANDAFAITASDTVDCARVTRGIYVGQTGDVTLVTRNGTTILFKNVPAGCVLPVRASRIKVTGTTADLFVGLD